MGVEEALEAAKIIKPDYVIPIHWGSLVGSEREVEEFKELCKEENIEVIVLNKI
jgi:L-ascorbate metabolism protein UlaG (beta-lactamase superfamily)